MSSSVLVSGNRLRLVLVFAFAISLCILDYPEFCSLPLSSVDQASQVYTGGHYGTMQAGRDPINVLLYTRVQLFSLRRRAVIDPTAAATICQFDLRRRRHRTWWGVESEVTGREREFNASLPYCHVVSTLNHVTTLTNYQHNQSGTVTTRLEIRVL